MISFYEAPESTTTISARQYTIEPGFPECRLKLDEYKGGGLGSNPPSVKYFDFVDNELCPLVDLAHVTVVALSGAACLIADKLH